jgi:hypothetical protein
VPVQTDSDHRKADDGLGWEGSGAQESRETWDDR